jgi:hypothetical protein
MQLYWHVLEVAALQPACICCQMKPYHHQITQSSHKINAIGPAPHQAKEDAA